MILSVTNTNSPSLRGGTTRQSVWDYGRFMRLPRRGAPRNDAVINTNIHNGKLAGQTT